MTPEQRAEHTCHARHCKAHVPPERLMCLKHWRMVPPNLQRRVWATYKPGQCDDWSLLTDEYLQAAQAAVDAVANRELDAAIPIRGRAAGGGA